MQLGEVVHINAGGESLPTTEASLSKLEFRPLQVEGLPLLTDGRIIIQLDRFRAFDTGLIYYAENIEETVKQLDDLDLDLRDVKTLNEEIVLTTLQDPNGVGISLVKEEMPELPLADGEAYGLGGNFYELSILTPSFDETINFWSRLGFEISYGNPKQDTWVTLTDELINIGIYREGTVPHIFNNPALTYFESDMGRRISSMKDKGIKFAAEMKNESGEISNAILETEDGLHFFFFTA